MPKFNTIKNSFSGGEVSPRCEARTDLPQYAHACKELKNFVVTQEGAATRRLGTRYLATSAKAGKLIPFIYSQDESYVIELTSAGIRSINVSTGTVSALVSFSSSVNFYSDSEVPQVQFVQSADIIFLAHPNYQPMLIKRTGTDLFALNTWASWVNMGTNLFEPLSLPYMDSNITSTVMNYRATGGDTLTSNIPYFSAAHCRGGLAAFGAIFKLTGSATTGAFEVLSTSGTPDPTTGLYTTVNVAPLTGASAYHTAVGEGFSNTDWQESSWSNYRGWPRAVAFFSGRLIFGGNANQPDTFWCSKSFNYSHFMKERFAQDGGSSDVSGLQYFGPQQATDPVPYPLASQQVNKIQWLASGKSLVAGTLGAEYVISNIDSTQLPDISSETSHGSGFAQPSRYDYSQAYIHRTGRRLYEMAFDFISETYVSEDILRWASHLPGKRSGTVCGIETLQFEESRGVLWCIDTKGGMFAVTRDKKNGIAAWHYHEIGGSYEDLTVWGPAYVNSICVVPSSFGHRDQIFLQVKRTSPTGVVTITVEAMSSEYSWTSMTTNLDVSDAPLFLDASIFVYNESGSLTIPGLSHLIGQQVTVIGDGFVLPDTPTVDSSGNITLSGVYYHVFAGLPYTSRIQTLRVDAGAALGSSQGAIKRIDRAVVRFFETMAGKIGYDPNKLEPIEFRDAQTPPGQPMPFFTGDKPIDFPGDYDRDNYVIIEQDQPLPMTVLGIILRGVTNES